MRGEGGVGVRRRLSGFDILINTAMTQMLATPRNLFTTTLDARYHSVNAATAADTAASREVHERA